MESKIDKFTARLQRAAATGKLLSHPARIAILEFLAEQNSCFSGDISKHLPLGRSTVAQHLNELKAAGWVKGIIQGSKISYCLDSKKIKNNSTELYAFLGTCNNSNIFNCE
ncbi:MAG: winged helix-turn-helix domain-containing protein [Fibrobacterales bacterium]